MNTIYDHEAKAEKIQDVVKLTKQKLAAQMHIGKEMFEDLTVDVIAEECYKDGVITFTELLTLYADELENYKIEYPRNWKEAFKNEHFPKWLKKKYPVKMVRHDIKVLEAYPEHPLPPEKFGKSLRTVNHKTHLDPFKKEEY